MVLIRLAVNVADNYSVNYGLRITSYLFRHFLRLRTKKPRPMPRLEVRNLQMLPPVTTQHPRTFAGAVRGDPLGLRLDR